MILFFCLPYSQIELFDLCPESIETRRGRSKYKFDVCDLSSWFIFQCSRLGWGRWGCWSFLIFDQNDFASPLLFSGSNQHPEINRSYIFWQMHSLSGWNLLFGVWSVPLDSHRQWNKPFMECWLLPPSIIRNIKLFPLPWMCGRILFIISWYIDPFNKKDRHAIITRTFFNLSGATDSLTCSSCLAGTFSSALGTNLSLLSLYLS